MRRRKRSYVIKDPDAEQRARLWRAWLVQMGLQLTHGYLMKLDGLPPKPMPLDFDADRTLAEDNQWFRGWYSTDGLGQMQAIGADETWRSFKYLIRIEDEGVEVYDTEKVFNKADIHGKFWKIERPI